MEHDLVEISEKKKLWKKIGSYDEKGLEKCKT